LPFISAHQLGDGGLVLTRKKQLDDPTATVIEHRDGEPNRVDRHPTIVRRVGIAA
jgi:hypothetical protein